MQQFVPLTLQFNVTVGGGQGAKTKRDASTNTRMCVTFEGEGKWPPLPRYLTYFWSRRRRSRAQGRNRVKQSAEATGWEKERSD